MTNMMIAVKKRSSRSKRVQADAVAKLNYLNSICTPEKGKLRPSMDINNINSKNSKFLQKKRALLALIFLIEKPKNNKTK